MTLAAYVSAVMALLLAPGPTNTLMGVAGAQRGFRRMLPLLPAEMAGYLLTVLPLLVFGQSLLASWPAAGTALKLAAAAWVMGLAVKLWGRAGDESAATVTARRICVTTMLNPKALIFGLVLLPPPAAPEFAARMGLFLLMVAGAAMAWGAGGALTRAGDTDGGRARLIQRAASVWLAVVSVTLVAGVIRA